MNGTSVLENHLPVPLGDDWYNTSATSISAVRIAQITYILLFCIIIYILKRDLKKRKSDITVDTDPYPKWLNIWSSSAMIIYSVLIVLSFIYSLFLTSSDIVLHIAFTMLSSNVADFALICVTMYQITRLQYCFSSKQVHSKKYGYSKFMFKLLYSIGALLCFLSLFIAIFLSYHLILDYNKDAIYSINMLSIYSIFASFQTTTYYLWDAMVLGLFIYKIFQIRQVTSFKEKNIYQRIGFILQKITTLTVIFQVKGFILLGIDIYCAFFLNGSWKTHIIYWISSSINSLISVILIYCMIEHNNDEYIQLITCCCRLNGPCAGCYNNVMIDNDAGKAATKSSNINESDIYDTQTHSIELEMAKYIDNSENTQTVIQFDCVSVM